MLRIAKHANLHHWARDVGQLNGAAEMLVLLRIIVLQPNLELDGLCEPPLFFSLASTTTWEIASLRASVCNLLQSRAQVSKRLQCVKDEVNVVCKTQKSQAT